MNALKTCEFSNFEIVLLTPAKIWNHDYYDLLWLKYRSDLGFNQ